MSVNSIMTRLEGDYSSLKRTLSQVNRDIKVTSSEFGAAASAVSKTNATLDQLENKNKSAAKAVEIYNKKLEQLKTLQDAISKQKGVDSYEYKEITSEINRATKAMNGYKNEIEQTNAQIDKMSQKSAMTFDKVSSSLRTVRNTGAVMSAAVTAPLVMFGKNAVQSYVDAQETEDLFKVSLGTNANDALSFVDEKTSKIKQIDPLVMKENIAVMYEMTHAMGVTSSSSLDMSKNLAMLAEDLGSLKNVDTSVAFDKLRSAMSGESEPLKAWGLFISSNDVYLIDTATEQQKMGKSIAVGIANAMGLKAKAVTPSKPVENKPSEVETLNNTIKTLNAKIATLEADYKVLQESKAKLISENELIKIRNEELADKCDEQQEKIISSNTQIEEYKKHTCTISEDKITVGQALSVLVKAIKQAFTKE